MSTTERPCTTQWTRSEHNFRVSAPTSALRRPSSNMGLPTSVCNPRHSSPWDNVPRTSSSTYGSGVSTTTSRTRDGYGSHTLPGQTRSSLHRPSPDLDQTPEAGRDPRRY